MNQTGFYKTTLLLENNLFNELSNSIDFEEVGKGRKANHLVKVGEKGIPIVRTTTRYNIPAHHFSSLHQEVIVAINDSIQNNLPEVPCLDCNNALIEIYDANYTKMKYHSDQCLDLERDSCIALFSCYENPDQLSEQHLRKLKLRDKTSLEESELLLSHNSVILFSLATNTKFLHKIVLEAISHSKAVESDNRWLGMTFRKSKTLIQFKDGQPHFSNGNLLNLANESERKEFYKLRGQENKSMSFIYPKLTYTLSPADMMRPKDAWR